MVPKVRPSPSGTASSAVSASKPEATIDFPNMLTTALHPLLDQMTHLNNNFETLQKQIKEINKTQNTAKSLKKLDAKKKALNQILEAVEKEKASDKQQLLQLQMEKSSYILRFLGISEQKGENLKDILSNALTPVVDLKMEFIQSEMDVVYRTYPDYIKKNKLPGEIFVKFSKRSTRDVILKVTNRITLKIKGEEIKILKDFLFEIRKNKQQYKKLTTFLQKNSTPYRWILPEGLIFNFKEKKQKTDSLTKSKAFLGQHQKTEKEKEKVEDNKVEEEYSGSGSGSNSSTLGSSSGEDSESDMGEAAPKFLKVRWDYDKDISLR